MNHKEMNEQDKRRLANLQVMRDDITVSMNELKARLKAVNQEMTAIYKAYEPDPGDPELAQKVGFGRLN